jgi:hypothetical protein
METLDALASRFGVRPSELIGETDGFQAFSIDLWAHNWGVQREQRLIREAQRKANRGRG